MTMTPMARTRQTKRRWGGLVASLGLLLIVFEVIWSRYLQGDTPSWSVILIGASIGFIGFYMVDPKDAHAGGDVLVGYGVQILSTIRGGRRATDPQIPVPEPVVARPDQPVPHPPTKPGDVEEPAPQDHGVPAR